MAEKSQRGSNLTREHRERGGRTSAAKQERDARGQFAGAKGKAKSRGRNDDQQAATQDRQQQGMTGQQPSSEPDKPELEHG